MKRLWAAVGVVAVGFSPGIASASTALILGGAGRYADLTDEELAKALGGYFADYDSRVNVPFAGTDDFGESIDAATDSMYDAVYNTPGRKTIGGVSQTAPAIAAVLRRLSEDPDAPPPNEVDAAMYGAPSPFFFRLSGVDYQPLPETPYNLLIVTAEYDGVADFPDNPFNLLAVVNAFMGYNQLHYPAAFTDISQVPAEYITTATNSKGGTTTTVLIPTPVLPVLKPLADIGVSDETVAYLDKILRPLVDSAYNRPGQGAAIPEGAGSDRHSLTVATETESDEGGDGTTDSQPLTPDSDAGEGGHVKQDDVERGKHAKDDQGDSADEDDTIDTSDADGAQRGKHAKTDKDDDQGDAEADNETDDKNTDDSAPDKPRSENAGASDAAA